MSRKVSVALILAIMLVLAVGGVAEAQRATPTNIPMQAGDDTVRGSIRGTIYDDRNGDGICSGTDDPIAVGVTIEFVSNDGQTTVHLQSGENGTYGLVAAGLGTWTVTVRPPENYVVTSAPSRQVFIGEENRVATGVDFCVRERATGPGPRPGGGHPGGPGPRYPILLPESGAAEQSSNDQPGAFLLVASIAGIAMVLAGAVLVVRDRSKGS